MAKKVNIEQLSSENQFNWEKFYRCSKLLSKSEYKQLMTFFKQNNITDINDVYIQKYRTKDAWENYNERELVDYFLEYIEKGSGYNYCDFKCKDSLIQWYRKCYQHKVCRALLKQVAHRDCLIKLFEAILQDNKLQIILQRLNKAKSQVILTLYNLLDSDAQFDILEWMCVNVFDNFSADDASSLNQCYSVKQYVNYVLRKGKTQSFTKVIKQVINKPNIVINKYFYDKLDFDEYKRSFTKLSTILISDTVYSFLPKEERSKHFEQLLKTATYTKTNIQYIKNEISSRVCKSREEQEALESILFLKTLAE